MYQGKNESARDRGTWDITEVKGGSPPVPSATIYKYCKFVNPSIPSSIGRTGEPVLTGLSPALKKIFGAGQKRDTTELAGKEIPGIRIRKRDPRDKDPEKRSQGSGSGKEIQEIRVPLCEADVTAPDFRGGERPASRATWLAKTAAEPMVA